MQIKLIETENEPWSYEKCLPDPEGPWTLAEDGLYYDKRVRGGDVIPTKVIGQPLFIKERVKDVDSDDGESVCLVWHDRGRACTALVKRQDIASSGPILKLANRGLMVNSHNSAKLVDYLAHLLDFNQQLIPVSYVASSCGSKQVEEKQIFMLGNDMITADNNSPLVSFDSQSDVGGSLKALRTEGSLDIWIEAAKELREYPLAAFGVAGSFMPPMLNDLNIQQNPLIDYSGPSSTGKSTVMTFAASVWGLPPQHRGGLIQSWQSTPFFLEKLAGMANELPVFLDESHIADPKIVRDMIYSYCNGSGRGRGCGNGNTREVTPFRGVLFSAGEEKLAEVSKYGGMQARIIGFWGSPFGQNKAEFVDRITQIACTNYGHAGRKFLREYMQDRSSCVEVALEVYENSCNRLATKVNDDITGRLAPLCAAVEAAGCLADLILDLGWDMSSIVDHAFKKLLCDRKSDTDQASIETLGEWVLQNEIYNSSKCSSARILKNIDGSMNLAIAVNTVRSILAENGYNYRSILPLWAKRGWLISDGDRNTKKTRINGRSENTVLLNEAGIAAAKGGIDEDDDVLIQLGYDGSDLEQTDEDQHTA